MAFRIYQSADCRPLYEELKNTMLNYMQEQGERLYVLQSSEEVNYLNVRSTNPPIVNNVHNRIFTIRFFNYDAVNNSQTRRDFQMVNQREQNSDTLFLVDTSLDRIFEIADPRISHNIPSYLKLFIDTMDNAQYQQGLLQDQRKRRFTLALAMHPRVEGSARHLGDVLRTGLIHDITGPRSLAP